MYCFISQRGRVFEYKQNYSEAKSNYEDAVSINPGHIKSLHHLVSDWSVKFHGSRADSTIVNFWNLFVKPRNSTQLKWTELYPYSLNRKISIKFVFQILA